MAYFSFAEAILQGRPITLYDRGLLRRDFTYIDDVVAGVLGCLDRPPAESGTRMRVLNIGNNHPERVIDLVDLLEKALGRPAVRRFAPRPAADVEATCADVAVIGALCGFTPSTPLAQGIERFSRWFLAWREGAETAK